MDLKVENGDLETGMVTIPKGASYFYKEAITKETLEDGQKNFNLSLNHNYLGQAKMLAVYPSLISEEKFQNFDLKEEHFSMNLSYEYKRRSESRVKIELSPVELKEFDPSDEIEYYVDLCTESSKAWATESYFCDYGLISGCVSAQRRVSAQQKESVIFNSGAIEDGKYFVRVTAEIIHQNQKIKFVQPYEISEIDIKAPYFENEKEPFVFWKGFVWILIAAILGLCFVGWKKLKAEKENKGVELQKKKDDGKKGWNHLEDDGKKGWDHLEDEEDGDGDDDDQIEVN